MHITRDVGTSYLHDYGSIARDVLAGLRVVVFCDNARQVERAKDGIVSALVDAGVERSRIVRSRHDRRVNVDGSHVWLCLTNGLDGRGLSADACCLSESARMQHDFARLMGAAVS